MAKQLKRRSSHLTVLGNGNDGKNDVIRELDAGGETYESEADALESLSQEGVQKASFDGVDFNETIKRLKERDLYYDSYADFMNSESKDGAYVEHQEPY